MIDILTYTSPELLLCLGIAFLYVLPKPCCFISVAFSLLITVNRIYQEIASPEPFILPQSRGLIYGLTGVVICQFLIIIYQFLRRETQIREASEQVRIQPKRKGFFLENFWKDTSNHFMNPSAFSLMLPYLVLTWLLNLMPSSYYVLYSNSTSSTVASFEENLNYQWPSFKNILLQLLIVDYFTYCYHIIEHNIPRLYINSHKPHHKYVSPQLFNAFDGSFVDTILLILLPLFTTAQLCHVTNWDYIIFGSVYSTHFTLIHSEYEHIFDDILQKLFVNTSEDHHVHHAFPKYNYSHFFTIFDKVAGTYKSGKELKGFRRYNSQKHK